MSAILQALGSGYTAKQILSYLSKQNPKLAAQVSTALNAGHTLEHVLNFISRHEKNIGKLVPEKSQTGNIFKQSQASIHPSLTGMAKFAGTAALAAGGAYALSRAAPQILQRGLAAGANPPIGQATTPISQNTSTLQNSGLANSGNQGISPVPQNQSQEINQAQQPSVNQVAPNIPQAQAVTQPQGISNPKEYLEKKGLLQLVNDSLARKNSPEQVAAEVGIKASGRSAIDPELVSVIEEYAKTQQQQPQLQKETTFPEAQLQPQEEKIIDFTGMGNAISENLYSGIFDALKNGKDTFSGVKDPFLQAAKPAFDAGQIKNVEDLKRFAKFYEKSKNQPKPIAKSDVVATPQGVGEVVAIRNGKAIVDVDGKKHQVEEKNLLKPPKEAAVEALELIKSFTPEAMRSTHHMLNSYDEQEKKGFFVFHNGSAYVVDDISPEEYKELSEEIEQAKTSGETIIGKWAAGEGSRGAAYNKVVKGVRERKVVPELKKKFRKLKVGYNLLSEWQRYLAEHEKDLKS